LELPVMESSVDLKQSYDRFFSMASIHPRGEKVLEIIDGKTEG
jgi:hypothetical protein